MATRKNKVGTVDFSVLTDYGIEVKKRGRGYTIPNVAEQLEKLVSISSEDPAVTRAVTETLKREKDRIRKQKTALSKLDPQSRVEREAIQNINKRIDAQRELLNSLISGQVEKKKGSKVSEAVHDVTKGGKAPAPKTEKVKLTSKQKKKLASKYNLPLKGSNVKEELERYTQTTVKDTVDNIIQHFATGGKGEKRFNDAEMNIINKGLEIMGYDLQGKIWSDMNDDENGRYADEKVREYFQEVIEIYEGLDTRQFSYEELEVLDEMVQIIGNVAGSIEEDVYNMYANLGIDTEID